MWMRVLTFGVTVPLWALIGAFLWAQFDKGSAVRRAVNELVAGAELEAERAKAEAAQRVLAEVSERAEALEAANLAFQAELDALNGDDDATISELEGVPVNDMCVVDGRVIELLRSR